MICYYHSSDLDGHCAGAIVKRRYPNCKMVPVNYGNPLPKSKDQDMFVVDFSWPLQQMLALAKCGKRTLIWIDHHKTAIEDEQDYCLVHDYAQKPILGIRKIGEAGCELTWKYLYPDESMPLAVYLLGRYDVWDHNDERTLPFQFGMRLYKNTHPQPENMWLWEKLLCSENEKTKLLQEILTNGAAVCKYRNSQNAKYAKSCAFDCSIAGYPAIACNVGLSNSQIFDSVFVPARHKIMCTFVFRNREWHCTLYSKNDGPDVGKIARELGGGGHEHAAGFKLKTLEFFGYG